MIDTVIFDMDGTIFDTERIYHDAWLASGVPEKLYWQIIGRGHEEIREIFRRNLSVPPEVLYARCDAATARLLVGGIPKKPGLEEVLQYLQRYAYHIVLATSSLAENTKRKIDRAGVSNAFEAVISGDMVKHGKPAPDIYLKAAKAVSRVPEACMVVEDSFNGVRGGHAAGMYTVMIPDMLQPDAEMRNTADTILSSLREVPALLEKQKREMQ
ncbi:MAG: HAD family phosphatase [Oscillospiraceae bacterium]|jgi:beta-phosphoglucomutase-like phosphatase (HAD superfamily)|nr:HAD family phosphatase [Oscillospiraceae bacterium]